MNTYLIHNNGDRPFSVRVSRAGQPKRIEVYRNTWNPNTSTYDAGARVYDTQRYERVFLGDNDLRLPTAEYPKGAAKGNTILVHLSGSRYLFIGATLFTFRVAPHDTIESFYSPIGGSDAPYPYAVGRTHVYFMLDHTRVPKDLIDVTKDGYAQYYGYAPPGSRESPKADAKAYAKNVIDPEKVRFSIQTIRS